VVNGTHAALDERVAPWRTGHVDRRRATRGDATIVDSHHAREVMPIEPQWLDGGRRGQE
jgi:hypothetical protein